MFASILSFALAHLSTITAVAGGAAGFKTAEVAVVKAVEKAKAWVAARAAKVEAAAKADAAKAETDAKAFEALVESKVNAALTKLVAAAPKV